MRSQYFLGLGLGVIPLIIFLIAYSFSITGPFSSTALTTIFISLGLYVIELVVTIVFLVIERFRFIGYGLLTAFLASPVIAVVGCIAIPNLVRPH